MHLKTLLLFIASVGGFFPSDASYAFNKVYSLQDSVKRIPITVIASEKPREVNFDSLLRSTSNEKPTKTHHGNKTGRTYNQSRSTTPKPELQNENAINNSQPVAQDNLSDQSAKSNTAIAKQVQNPSSKVDEHPEEVRNIPATDDTILHEAKTARTYLWIGFMLIVVGIILGILFGKTALLISIAGAVFVVIGYTI